FFLAGFHKNLIASGIQQDLSFIFQVPVPSSIEINPLSTIWKYKFCSGVKRNSYLKKDSFFLPFPAGFIKTSGRVIRTPGKTQPPVRFGSDHCPPKTWSFFRRIQSAHTAVHPLCDHSMCIMIQTVHTSVTDVAVRKDGIPAFPYSSGSHVHLIKPAGIFLLEKQTVS